MWLYGWWIGCGIFMLGFMTGSAMSNAKHADNVIDLASEREKRRRVA